MFKPLKSFVDWRRRRRLANASQQEVFTRYFRRNSWGDKESRSGKGSNLSVTATLRDVLPSLLRDLNVMSIVDVPCGDFHWMKEVDLDQIDYFGGDLVEEMILANRKYERPGRRFGTVNLCDDPLPKADLVFTRDCLVHLSLRDAKAAINNIRASGATYLMATTFPDTAENVDILTGQWRALDLCKKPFAFPTPLRMVKERLSKTDGSFSDKSMGVWAVADIPAQL